MFDSDRRFGCWAAQDVGWLCETAGVRNRLIRSARGMPWKTPFAIGELGNFLHPGKTCAIVEDWYDRCPWRLLDLVARGEKGSGVRWPSLVFRTWNDRKRASNSPADAPP